VENYFSQAWDLPEVEIFMDLKEETVASSTNHSSMPTPVSELFFVQTFQTLDYLACHDSIYRGVAVGIESQTKQQQRTG
jgi:hypothetical protein